jgi:hypothetical protein
MVKSFSLMANLNASVNYHSILTLENVGTKVTYGIFIILAPGVNP